jgi:hypothetical protein
MKKLLIAALVAAAVVVVPLRPLAQVNEQLSEFMRPLPIDGLPLAAVHMNDRTVALLFQPPTVYAMRAKANEVTSFYVQGVADKAIELDTTAFSVEQSSTYPATPISIHNFTKGKVKLMKGDRVDGVLTLARKLDYTHGFTLKYGKVSTDFSLVNSIDNMRAPTSR